MTSHKPATPEQKKKYTKIAIGALFAVHAAVLGGMAAYELGTKDEAEFTVRSKERVTTGQKSEYLVFTDRGVFQNTDSMFNGKYNSSDLYNDMEQGKSYKCDVYGKRIPLLSMYQNLLKCTPKP